MKVSASIVTYKNDRKTLGKAIHSILGTDLDIKLFIVDNSPTPIIGEWFPDPRVEYIFVNKNIGFGAAHNIAFGKALAMDYKYHLVINPDIYFHGDAISPMLEYMEHDDQVGMMMPKILNTDGSLQYLPKLLPTPFSLLFRKLKRPHKQYDNFIRKYELRDVSDKIIYNAPILSGCFTLLNLEIIRELGGYDERYFMYFEDFDLSRKIHRKYKTLYFPLVFVYHEYEGGANKNGRLFRIFICSAVKYFNKWGWMFDKERKRINDNVLTDLGLE